MPADLIVTRHYLDGAERRVEEIIWRHVPDPEPRYRLVKRRFRSPKVAHVPDSDPDPRARPLPEWCAPTDKVNRWLWIKASNAAADLRSVRPNEVEGTTKFFWPESPYWDYYALPLRAGVELACRP